MEESNGLLHCNGVHLAHLKTEPLETPREEIVRSNLRTIWEAMLAIASSATPVNHFGGELLTEVTPKGCVLGRRRERSSYPAPFYSRKKLVIHLRYLRDGIAKIERVKAHQFIPRIQVIPTTQPAAK